MGNQLQVLFLAFLLWFCHGATTAATPACKAKERQALMELKAGLRDPSGRMSSWVGKDCCTWSGVACNNQTGHVIRLNLRNPDDSDESMNTGLQGEINPSLVQLGHLRYLDLSNNDFRGVQVPPFIGTFKELRYLNLSLNWFFGTVPHQLGNLSSLRSLDLSYNDYYPHELVVDGSHWLSQLSSLRYLDMSSVNLGKASNCLQTISALPSIREIHLPDCHLGTIPLSLPHVNFTSLSLLDLSDNLFSTKMPNWLFNLTGLEFLYLSENQFQGLLSDAIGNMTSLKELDLSIYEGRPQIRIPETLQKLCRLRTLYLSGWNISNSLDGLGRILSGCIRNSLSELDLSWTLIGGSKPNLPSWLLNLTSLRYLGTSVYGSIPPAIGNMTLLETLHLSGSNLEGPLPLTLGKLCRLQSLSLSRCNITPTLDDFGGIFSGCIGNSLTHLSIYESLLYGVLPEWLGNLKSLKYLYLFDNMLNATIPENLGKLSELERLVLSNNNLSGPIPHGGLEAMSNLEFIDLSSNFFSGHLPHLPMNVLLADLSNNSFSGPIPQGLVKKQSPLGYLSLSMNNINGTIPSNLCELENMGILVLSNNQISGEIPHCLLQSSTLTILDISSNKISGIIPNFTSSASSLEQLHLNNNSLFGELPYFLKSCQNMVILDLGHNKFSGKIPSWIGESLSSLRILILRSNLFNGELPQMLHRLTTLQILDLSHNHLSGTIPQSFGNFTTMKHVNMNPLNSSGQYDNYYTGSIILEDKGLDMPFVVTQVSLVVAMDLSDNNLFGTIPKELVDLHGLQILNVSGNNLSGRIMAEIGELRQLESLDLSMNQLSGGIPINMCGLNFLESLNLSYNNFSGKIPSGGQFNTFVDPSIYAGNHDLCGFPLTNDCMGDENTTIIPDYDGTEEDEMLWFYLGIIAGFGLGFWGVWGILLVKRSWRYSYYRFIDKLYAAIRINFGS